MDGNAGGVLMLHRYELHRADGPGVTYVEAAGIKVTPVGALEVFDAKGKPFLVLAPGVWMSVHRLQVVLTPEQRAEAN